MLLHIVYSKKESGQTILSHPLKEVVKKQLNPNNKQERILFNDFSLLKKLLAYF